VSTFEDPPDEDPGDHDTKRQISEGSIHAWFVSSVGSTNENVLTMPNAFSVVVTHFVGMTLDSMWSGP